MLSAFFLSFTGPVMEGKQIFKTSLQIIVRNELGNVEKGAKVTLYKNEEDYNASKYPVAEKETDDKGKVLFDQLEPIAYYIKAEKGDIDNFGAGEKIPELEKNKMNKATIIISE